jgi:HSP20 family molecular chaperone IbpA
MAFDFRGEAVRGLVVLRDILDRLIGEEAAPQTLPVDVLETDEHFILYAALPGIQPDDVVVQVQGNLITIQASAKTADQQPWLIHERLSAPYARTVVLPAGIAAEEASARLADGLLTLTLPKAAPVKTITFAPRLSAEETTVHDAIREAEAIITAHLEDLSATAPTEEVMNLPAEQLFAEELFITEPLAEEPATDEPLAEEQATDEPLAEESLASDLPDEEPGAAEEISAEMIAVLATTASVDEPPMIDEATGMAAAEEIVIVEENTVEDAVAAEEIEAEGEVAEESAAEHEEVLETIATSETMVDGELADAEPAALEAAPEANMAGAEETPLTAEEAVPVLADTTAPDLLADTLIADELAETRADIPLADVLEDDAAPEPVGELTAAHEDSHS